VRPIRLIGVQAELWPDWRHFPFITKCSEPLELIEAEYRQHAVVELMIRDLQAQAFAHFDSGKFNGAWTVVASLAHNLSRWTALIGLPGQTRRAARTLRRRLLRIPGRLTCSGRRWTLHLPPAGPGRVTSSVRSHGSGHCRRRLSQRQQLTLTNTLDTRPGRCPKNSAKEHFAGSFHASRTHAKPIRLTTARIPHH
jgi:hypothetical protein